MANGGHPIFNIGLVAPVLLSVIGATAWIGLFYGGDHESIARLERDVEKNSRIIASLPAEDAKIRTDIENIKMELSRYYAQKEEVTRLNSKVGADMAELAQRIKDVEERVREHQP